MLDSIRDFVSGSEDISELDSSQAKRLFLDLAEKYDRDPKAIWWWENLLRPAETLNYGDSDPSSWILERVKPEAQVLLIVTDEEPGPWPVFQGTARNLMELIFEQHYFEYTLAAPDGSWLIMDNHHSTLFFVSA